MCTLNQHNPGFIAKQKWSLAGVQLEEFKQAASVRSNRLKDAERDLRAALAGKQDACKAIAAWENSIPKDKVTRRALLTAQKTLVSVGKNGQNST